MRPEASIPPTTLIRRRGAKRWHILHLRTATGLTECGQNIKEPWSKIALNAEEITCNDCLVDAISAKLRERAQAE